MSPNSLYALSMHLVCQIALFTGMWFQYSSNNNFRCACRKFQESFPLAKASASLVSFNLFLLILVSLKSIRYYLWVPPYIKAFHYIASTFVVLWSIIHTVAHYMNFSKLTARYQQAANNTVGYTGIMLWLILLASTTFAIPRIREHYYHKFVYYHTILFILFISFLYIHQTFCFIKTDKGKCPLPTSWIFVTPVVLVYIFENAYKYLSNQVRVERVIQHRGITEVILPVRRYSSAYAGKTVWICCPQVSYFEWHPFAVTSVQDTSDGSTISIHFKVRGNWTRKFASALGVQDSKTFPVILPSVYIQGAFHSYPKDTLQRLQHSNCIVIASGIGTTTFAYLLSQLQTCTLNGQLHILLIVKHPDDIEWLLPLLATLATEQPSVNVHLAFTQVNISFLPNQLEEHPFTITFGRPDIKEFFSSHYIQNTYNMGHHTPEPTYVYFSGSTNVFQQARSCTREYNTQYKLIRL